MTQKGSGETIAQLKAEAQKREAQAKQFHVPSNKSTPVPAEAPKFADMATVAVRPEAIAVEQAPGPAGALAGTIVKSSYLGIHMEYSIDTTAGALFATCPWVERPLGIGDKVAPVLAPRGVIVVESR